MIHDAEQTVCENYIFNLYLRYKYSLILSISCASCAKVCLLKALNAKEEVFLTNPLDRMTRESFDRLTKQNAYELLGINDDLLQFNTCICSYLFSHTQMSECDFSDHPVSIVVVVVVVSMNFCTFSTSRKPLQGYAPKFVRMFLGWTTTKC